MSLQIRRGTDAERLTITPLTAELIYTIDTQLVYVGDGVTAGGILVGSGGGNGNYGNANVVSLLNSGLAGNIIPTVDSLYSLGNATNQWADLYVSNNTIYLNNVPLSGNATTLSYDGIPLISANGTSNITTTGNITGAFILGDGSQLTGLPSGYSNADVANYLASGTVTTDIITTANISAGDVTLNNLYSPNYFANAIAFANATGYITTSSLFKYNSGTEVLTVGTVSATGNITGDYFIGNGSQLTGLPAGYSNADVATYLASGTLTSNVITTGNVDAGFFIGDGSQLTNLSTGVTAIPAIYFPVVADGNNQTFSNSFLSAYSSNTDITLFYNGALLDSPYYTLSGDTITVNTVLTTGDSIDVIRQFVSNVVVSTYSNANVQSYLASASIGDIIPAGNNLASLGNATNQWKDLWVSNATIYFDTIPLTVNSNSDLTFDGNVLVVSGGNVEISTTGDITGGNLVALGDVSSNTFAGNTANFASNVTTGGILTDNYYYANGSPISFDGSYSNANVANYLPTYTGNFTAGNIAVTGDLSSNTFGSNTAAFSGNITVGGILTDSYYYANGSPVVFSDYGNSNVANYLPTYTGNLDSVNIITANVISSNATIIANSVTLGTVATPVSVSQWIQVTTASTVPVVLMTISATDVTHVDFNVVATDATTTSRQVSKLMAISYNGSLDYNEYGSLLIGSTVGDFTVTTDGTDIFLNVIPAVTDSVDYNVVAMIYY
jgi:hypothetical protein